MARERKRINLDGIDSEEKFKQVERFLNRLRRRAPRAVPTIISPVPIFFNKEKADEKGVVGQAISMLTGEVVRIGVGFLVKDEERSKEVVYANFQVKDSVSMSGASLATKKFSAVKDVSFPISAGSLIQVSVSPPEIVSGICVGLLVRPGNWDAKVEEILLEDFAKEDEEEDEDGNVLLDG